MQSFQIQSNAGIPDALRRVELPELDAVGPAPGQVRLKIHACSLNFRDTIITAGGYPRNEMNPVVPLSDAAAEVVAVGEGVQAWSPGDRVMPNFLRDHLAGSPTEAALASGFGGGLDGFLREQADVPASCLVRIPDDLSYEQASTLPCAALTAWNALTSANATAGQTVLLLGTGGVSVFGLQLAKAMGLETILTSSSDDKLKLARGLGVDHTVNYAHHPQWHEQVRELTGGRGVDHVLEVGGAGTLERSLLSVAVGGTVSLIGLLTNPQQQPSILPALLNAVTIRGIYVGSVAQLEALTRAVSHHRLEPVIDRVFSFNDAPAAYQHLRSQQHVGKVVIRVNPAD